METYVCECFKFILFQWEESTGRCYQMFYNMLFLFWNCDKQDQMLIVITKPKQLEKNWHLNVWIINSLHHGLIKLKNLYSKHIQTLLLGADIFV